MSKILVAGKPPDWNRLECYSAAFQSLFWNDLDVTSG